MKIRSQLILAFLLLAVLPLATIVLFSYWSSERSIRQATAQEAGRMASRLEELMRDARGGLQTRFELLRSVPSEQWTHPEVKQRVGATMGESLGFLEQLSFVPTAPPPPDPDGDPPPPPEVGAAPPDQGQDVPGAMEFEIRQMESHEVDIQDVDDDVIVVFRNEGTGAAQQVNPEWIAQQVGQARSRFQEAQQLATEAAQAEQERLLQSAVEVAQERLAGAPLGLQRILGDIAQELRAPVLGEGGEIIGQIAAKVRVDLLLRQVLAAADRDQGEVPFAVDDNGKIYTQNETDRIELAAIGLDPKALAADPDSFSNRDWVLARHRDPVSNLTFWVVKPLGENLAELRRSQLRNFAFGLALVLLALGGILPFTGRLSRRLEQLTKGARRIASGDLQTRVDVDGRGEVGELARAFNSMAVDLGDQRLQLVREERQRQRQATEKQLLEAAYQRKSLELEQARQFQLSLLPTQVPNQPDFEIDVHMQTATEVGGDYYDFLGSAPLVTAIGDATGHGARAGTMVTVIKSLLMADGGVSSPRDFLSQANRAVRRMHLRRMTMALTLLRLDGRRATLSSAGMPPALIYRRGSGQVEEIVLCGLPLGGLADPHYQQVEVDLEPGDSLLLLSDGLPELPDQDGAPFGYARLRDLFASCGAGSPAEIIACLVETTASWTGGEPPPDDVTFLVLRARG